MRRVNILFAGLLILAATTSWAQTKPASTITVKVEDLNCTSVLGTGTFAVQTWSFGATQTGTGSSGGGGGAGKATVSGLKVEKGFDQCSPVLFAGVTTGKHFRNVTVEQRDDKNTLIMTVTLSDVVISSYVLGGSQVNRNPSEEIVFNFAKACINDQQSGTQACFDFVSQTTN